MTYKKLANIKKITDPWIGTPFIQNLGIIGVGTDCRHLVNALIEEITETKLERSIEPIRHGHQATIYDFLDYYPSTKLNSAVKGTVIFKVIRSSPMLAMAINQETMIMVHQELGVIYNRIPKDSLYYLPHCYHLGNNIQGMGNGKWVTVSRCNGC